MRDDDEKEEGEGAPSLFPNICWLLSLLILSPHSLLNTQLGFLQGHCDLLTGQSLIIFHCILILCHAR